MERVTTYLSDEDAATLADLESELEADRSAVLRRLIRRGLDEWREERALEQLADHSVTLRQAVDIANVPYVEMVSLAAEEEIEIGYTSADRERDLSHR